MTPVTLASTSAVRRSLLCNAGVQFETVASGVDENVTKAKLLAEGAGPSAIASLLADEKAQKVSRQRRGLVVGADQTLECDGRLYDKAASVDEARSRLTVLRGRDHLLHTAVALATDGEILWRALETARLKMRPFTDRWLESYLHREGDGVLGSVGGYRLEGEGVQLFERIEGDYFAILGLPLLPLLAVLRERDGLAS